MNFPFREKYKVDGHFGEIRSYGYHSGVDINGILGGNTDCGYHLFPITVGELIHASTAESGYGNVVVYRIDGEWGERWVRYCHCENIWKQYGIIEPDLVVATLGTTGNSSACHLHWDIIKKPMRNWRTYARTKELLDEYFDDPLQFYSTWKNYEGINMQEELNKLKEKLEWYEKEYPLEQERLRDCRQEKITLAEDFTREIQSCTDGRQAFISLLANKLDVKEAEKDIVGAVETALDRPKAIDQYSIGELAGVIFDRLMNRFEKR